MTKQLFQKAPQGTQRKRRGVELPKMTKKLLQKAPQGTQRKKRGVELPKMTKITEI